MSAFQASAIEATVIEARTGGPNATVALGASSLALRSARARGAATAPIALACFLGGVVVYRYLVLVRTGAPATVDMGNWMAFGHALVGEHLRSPSIVYPPVVPLVVTGAVSVLGVVRGVAVVSALASLAPAVGVYIVLRSAAERWLAVVLAALIAVAGLTGEAAAWGGVPQLLGLGLAVVFLWQLDGYLLSGRRPDLVRSALVLAVLAATSDLIVGGVAVAAVFLVTLRLSVSRYDEPRPTRRHLIARLSLVAVPSLVFAPLYVHLSHAVLATGAQRPAGTRLTTGNLFSHLDFLYRDFRSAWQVGVVLAVLSPFFLLDRRRDQLWVLLAALLGAVGLTAVVLREDRFLYMLPIAVVLAVGAWHQVLVAASSDTALRVVRLGLGVVLVGVLAGQTITGAQRFGQQRRYYGILNPDLMSAIDWVRSSTPSGSIIAVASVRNAPLGWWVEGLAHRLTLPAAPLQWLSYGDERRRARLANAIFTSDFPDVATMALAAGDGATYLLVPTDADLVDPHRLAAFENEHPSLVAFARPGAVVLRTG